MNRKKRVLVVATSSKTRGGITSVIKAHQKADFWKEWNCKWIETHIDSSIFLKISYAILAFIKFILNIPSANIVHIHLSGPISTKRKQVFIKLTKWFKKPLIIHFHAFSAEANIDLRYKSLYLRSFNAADKVIVLSESWKQGLIDDLRISSNKIEVLYNPCPIIELNQSIQKENIILFAGTLNERKNYKTLIKAFAIIAKEFPSWKLVFAGNGEVDQAIELAQTLNIGDQIICKGWISGDDKHQLFSEASIFCLPSFAEGFPMAVLDAWSYGLPVLTTPVGGIPEVALDGENIILFKANDVNDLANKLKKVIIDDELKTRLANSAFVFSSTQFSLNKIESDLTEIYENCLKL
jgi:glycosyltransferase involved in cell wall biosynthesis